MSESVKLRCCVTGSVQFKESSRMLELLCAERGFISASAKGVMRTKGPLKAACELFALCTFTLSGREGRYTVAGADLEELHYPLRGDLLRLNCAVYMRDILRAVASGEGSAALFSLFTGSLGALCCESIPWEVAKNYFELHALDLTGFAPALTSCALCARPITAGCGFSPSSGGALCGECSGKVNDSLGLCAGSAAHLIHLREWQSERLSVLKANRRVQSEVNEALQKYITYHFERSFRISPFMKKLDAFDATALSSPKKTESIQ